MNSTFRDPDGRCWLEDNSVFRQVFPSGEAAFRKFHSSDLSRSLQERGLIPRTRVLPDAEAVALSVRCDLPNEGVFLEHERIGFPSYSHEWSAEMLYAAGLATLNIQAEALAAGFSLKDATPTNILFRGSQCVFVDYLSFAPVVDSEYLWLAEGQFVRNFVLPLILLRHGGEATHAAFWNRRDGLEPGEVYGKLGWLTRVKPSVLRFVSAPTWFARSRDAAVAKPRSAAGDTERNAYLRRALFASLRNAYTKLSPAHYSQSRWSDYMSEHNYDPEAFRAKELFVQSALAQATPRRLLDVGSNTGHFSRVAARSGAEVVAVDYDAVSVDRVFRMADEEKLNILPLVVNLAWPTPALGWEYGEKSSFFARADGYFDYALMLAVIHHLSATDGIPLPSIFARLAGLVRHGAVVEYVSAEDSMMRRLLHNKDHLVPKLTQQAFEAAFAPWFAMERKQPVSAGRRCLYQLRRLDSGKSSA